MGAAIRLMSLAVLLAAPAGAQQYLANLRGTVWSPDGSPAAGIPLVIVREAGGETRRVVSDAEGRYTIVGLLPGVYRIEASDRRHPEFAIRTNVSIAQDRELDLRLGLVPVTVGVDFRPTFIPIDRGSPALTTRITGSFLTRLPYDGRNFIETPLLSTGTAPGRVAVASNGVDDLFTAYLIDGIYDIDPRLGAPAVRPQLDSIDEMEVRFIRSMLVERSSEM